MGLREKVALIFLVTFQITSTLSIPQNSRKYTLDKFLQSPSKTSSTNLNYVPSCGKYNPRSSVLKEFNFEEVEYPTFNFNDAIHFSNDNNEHGLCTSSATNQCLNPKSQEFINKLKKEARMKRKFNAIKHLKTEPSGLPQEQLYSQFTPGRERNILDQIEFPEVEYPLSTADMWTSKYKNYLPYAHNTGCQFPSEDIYVMPCSKSKLKKQLLRRPEKLTITSTIKDLENHTFTQDETTKHSNRKRTKKKRNQKLSIKQIKTNETESCSVDTCHSKNNSIVQVANEPIDFDTKNELTYLSDGTYTQCPLSDLKHYEDFNNPLDSNVDNTTGSISIPDYIMCENAHENTLSMENNASPVCLPNNTTCNKGFTKNNKGSKLKDKFMLYIDDLIKEAIRTFSYAEQPIFDRSVLNETTQRKNNESNVTYNNFVRKKYTHQSNKTSHSATHLPDFNHSPTKNFSEPTSSNNSTTNNSSCDMPLKISLLTPTFLEATCNKLGSNENNMSFEKEIDVGKDTCEWKDELLDPILICNCDLTSTRNMSDLNENSLTKLTVVPYTGSFESLFENLHENITYPNDGKNYSYIGKQIIEAPNLNTLIIKNPTIYNNEKKMSYAPIIIFQSLDSKLPCDNSSQTKPCFDPAIELLVYFNSSDVNESESNLTLQETHDETVCATPTPDVIEVIVLTNEKPTNETITCLQESIDHLLSKNVCYDFEMKEDPANEKRMDTLHSTSALQNENFSLIEIIIDLVFEDKRTNEPIEIFIEPHLSFIPPHSNDYQIVPSNLGNSSNNFAAPANNIHEKNNTISKTNDVNKENQRKQETSEKVEKNKTIEENDPKNQNTKSTQSPPKTLVTDNITDKENRTEPTSNVWNTDEKKQKTSDVWPDDMFHPKDDHTKIVKDDPIYPPLSKGINKNVKSSKSDTSFLNKMKTTISDPVLLPNGSTNGNSQQISPDNLKVKPSSNGKTPNDFDFDPNYEKRIDIHDKSHNIPKDKMHILKDPNKDSLSKINTVPKTDKLTATRHSTNSSSEAIKDMAFTDSHSVPRNMHKNINKDIETKNSTPTHYPLIDEPSSEHNLWQNYKPEQMDTINKTPSHVTPISNDVPEKKSDDDVMSHLNKPNSFPPTKENPTDMNRDILISDDKHSKFSKDVPNQVNNAPVDRNFGEDTTSHYDSPNTQQLTNENKTSQTSTPNLKSNNGKLTNKQIISEYRDHFRNLSQVNEKQNIKNSSISNKPKTVDSSKSKEIIKSENSSSTNHNKQLSQKQLIEEYRNHFMNGSLPSKKNESLNKSKILNEDKTDTTESNKDSNKLTPKEVIKQYRDYFRNETNPKINNTTHTPNQTLSDTEDSHLENNDFKDDPNRKQEEVNAIDPNKRNAEEIQNGMSEVLEPEEDITYIVISGMDYGPQDDIEPYEVSVTDMPYNSDEVNENAIEIEIINTITTIHESDGLEKRSVPTDTYFSPSSADLNDKVLYDSTPFDNLYRGTETSTKEYTLEDDLLVPAVTIKKSKPDVID